ncbi:Sporulation domain-containing protein [Legionella sainthelensi]|uniref:Sporulation domain-containing protein n=1 Tax=Legionella sainthelensi TaxID=28087 RepID=A0A0W0YC35_9GAMM|nr:SPOR domain-containing protein [Legionella sainthelensi]KTD54322.1 Sporulation domain-containing protein [Legionella sainthelensi]VEH30615.1 Sporulation domain-containing protein [Legionella sainthelensi]
MAREYNNKRSSRSRSGASHHFLLITVIFLLGYMAASFFDFETIMHWVNTQVLAHHDAKKESAKPEAPQQAVIPPKPKFEFYTLLANEKTPASQANNATTAAQSTAAASSNVTTVQPASVANANPATNVVTASSPTTVPVTNAVTAASTTATSSQVKSNITQQPPAPARAIATKTAPVSAGGNYLVQVASFKARQDAEHMKGTLILKGFSVYIIPVSHPTKGNWFRVVVGPYSNRGLAQQAQINLARNERLNGMITTGG